MPDDAARGGARRPRRRRRWAASIRARAPSAGNRAGDHVPARPRRRLRLGADLWARRQPDLSARPGSPDRARGRCRVAAVRLGHGRGDGRVPGAGPRQPCDRAAGDVLGAARLGAWSRPTRWGDRDRARGYERPRAAGIGGAARPDPTGLAGDASQSLLGDQRHRRPPPRSRTGRGQGSRSIRRWRRRCSPSRWRWARTW